MIPVDILINILSYNCINKKYFYHYLQLCKNINIKKYEEITRKLSFKISNMTTKYFIENTDHFLNLYYDTNREHIIPRVYSNSKSMGEGIMTIFALFYIFENNICFDNLFKISGRYWLNENFHYEDHEPNKSSIKYIDNNVNNCLTALYKLSYHTADKWHYYLMNSNDKFMTCTSYEEIFADFMKTIDDNEKKRIENKIGVSGYISVDGFYIDT